MLSEYKENKLIEIFVQVDDFCQELEQWLRSQGKYKPIYHGRMSMSEMMAILIFYHHSGYKCFQYYYEEMIRFDIADDFPLAVSYKHFLSLIPRCLNHLFLFSKWQCSQALPADAYYIDSKKLPICHNRRIKSNRVFKHIAMHGKSSTGWFYGFKIHLVINNLGEIAAFELSTANIADNNHELLKEIFKNLKGNCYGDKGYITSIFEELYEQGIRLISKVRSNMKNKLIHLSDRYYLFKRGVIESVNDILMTVCDIEHTRHRSPLNFLTHTVGAVIAYGFLDQKPSVHLPNLLN
jgi:hypothetical protein